MTEVALQAEHSAVSRWRVLFAENAVVALSQALASQISLGPYDQARPAEALVQILAEADYSQADQALCQWLGQRLGLPVPEGLTGKRFANALQEAFRLALLLRFKTSRAWCIQHHGELRHWLRGFYFGASRDPEAALFALLVQGQTNRGLLPLWLSLVRKGRPIPQVRQALAGLRFLPADDQGKVERGLPRALLQGLVEYGNTLARTGDKKGTDWFLEVDFLAAAYPMSKDAWGRKFREVVANSKPADRVKNWLDQRYPLALKPFESGARKGPLEPPYFKAIEPLLIKAKTDFEQLKPKLSQFVEESRHYCRESGDSSYLVRSFCFAGDRLLKVDPVWARELAHEAAIWEPNNPNCWSVLARALEEEGDWRRAEAVFWQARRRFPENAFAHSQLAHALLLHGQAEVGEAVYRQAIQFFPDDPICRNDLAHTLRITGRLEDALVVYRETQGIFHRDPVIANAIADILIELNRLDEAETALTWAEQVQPSDDKSERIVNAIRSRLKNALSGQLNIAKTLQPRPDIAGGSLSALADITGSDFSLAPSQGQATLWRRQPNDGLALAENLIAGLPEGPEKFVERGLWLAAQNGWAAAAKYYDLVWKGFEGDGVLRVHRQRAHARCGEKVDWSTERRQYPELISVILTEEQGRPSAIQLPQDEEDISQEQHRDAWFADLINRNDTNLTDWVQEDYLAAKYAA